MSVYLVTSRAVPKRFPGGWSPKELGTTALACWVDADDPSTITISTGVSQWNDKSGNGRNLAQATGANQPTYVRSAQNGRAVVRFDGSNDNIASTGTGITAQPYSYVFVVKQTATNTSTRYVHVAGNSLSNYDAASPGGYLNYAGTASTRRGGVDTNFRIHVPLYNGASSDMWIDGTNQGTNSIGTNVPTTFRLGYTSASWNGDIGEFMAINGTLASGDREKIEGYLAHKWGISSVLPSGHPYKSKAP